MNQYVTGAVIKELREKNKMTQLQPKIRTIVTQNLRFENTKPGQEQAIPFDGLCSPASSAYG